MKINSKPITAKNFIRKENIVELPKFSVFADEKGRISSTRHQKIIRNVSMYKNATLNFSLNRTQKLQKSLTVIRDKKVQEKVKQNYFLDKKRIKIQIIQKNSDIDRKFKAAAIKIQKFIRGYLTRKKYRPLILEHSKALLKNHLKNLKNRIKLIWYNLGNLNASAQTIQRHTKGYFQRKKYKVMVELDKLNKNILENHCARVIQRRYRIYKSHLNQILKQKLSKISENLKFLRVKYLWERCKYNWKTIQDHYAIKTIPKLPIFSLPTPQIVIIPSTIQTSTLISEKRNKSKNSIKRKYKLKPKTLKSRNLSSYFSSDTKNNPGTPKKINSNSKNIFNIDIEAPRNSFPYSSYDKKRDLESPKETNPNFKNSFNIDIEIPTEKITNFFGGIKPKYLDQDILPEGIKLKNGKFYYNSSIHDDFSLVPQEENRNDHSSYLKKLTR